MAVIGQWKQFIRVRQEASFNAANPQTAQEWNVKAGATGWIVKPFDPTKLIDAIERVTA